MNKRTTKNHVLPAGLVEAYRNDPAFSIADAVQGLASFLSHRALFEALGDTRMAAAAERAWWQDANLLAGASSASIEEATLKIEALQPALDGRVWATAHEGHRCLVAIITVAVEAERSRWGLPRATRH